MHEWIMLKQKHKHILQHGKSHRHQHKTQITKRECWPYSLQAFVTWAAATSLGRLESLGWTVLGLREVGRMCQSMNPAPWTGVSVPLCTSPQPPDPGSFTAVGAVKLFLLHPKDVELLGWKSFEKPPGPHVSRWWGSHLQLPSLGSPQLWWEPPPESCAAEAWMCPGHRGKEGRRNGTQALGVSSSTFHSNWQSRNRTFAKALLPPVTGEGHKDTLLPCGHFP